MMMRSVFLGLRASAWCLVVLGTSGCAAVPATGQEPPGTAKPPPCATLSEAACLESERCTLEVVEGEDGAGKAIPEGTGGYRCRAAEGPCEIGFRQGSGSAEECAARPGCRFIPGRCYCPPGVVCICGGGPPPRCAEEHPDEAP
jgi:hypothetical protein